MTPPERLRTSSSASLAPNLNPEENFLAEYFSRYREAIFKPEIRAQIIELKDLAIEVRKFRKKIIIAGNGGSAAIAAHCAIDFTKNAGVRCVNFSDASLITCLANDFGYERWLEKALELYAEESDLIVLISSSGKSPNMVRAAEYALSKGHHLVTFTGFAIDNPLKSKGKLNFWVDSRAYNIVEMTHHIWLLAVCDLIIGRAEYPAS